MQVSGGKNFFILPDTNHMFVEGTTWDISFSNKKGKTLHEQTFQTKEAFQTFLDTYCAPWKKEHPLMTFFRKNEEVREAFTDGLLVASAHQIKVMIEEDHFVPYKLPEETEDFYFFTALVKTKNQYFTIHTKGNKKKDLLTSSTTYEYQGLKNRKTGTFFKVKVGPPRQRARSQSLPDQRTLEHMIHSQ